MGQWDSKAVGQWDSGTVGWWDSGTGENWQRETFGWSREEDIPGWELNLSWLKDDGFPQKGILRLDYYSGADKGCGPVWPTRKELAESSSLSGVPHNLEHLVMYVDSLSMLAVPTNSRKESRKPTSGTNSPPSSSGHNGTTADNS